MDPPLRRHIVFLETVYSFLFVRFLFVFAWDFSVDWLLVVVHARRTRKEEEYLLSFCALVTKPRVDHEIRLTVFVEVTGKVIS